jgi:anti-sigma factor RsiW
VFKKSQSPKGCRKLEARLEDYLGGAADSELQRHLAGCAACRAALEDSRLAGNLLREALEPSSEPHPAFLAGVMARIREEKVRAESPAAFWRPLEFLASRLALTAAVLLLGISAYLVEAAPGRNLAQIPSRSELSASDLPQPPQDPVSNEEILQSLAEREYGR